MKRIFADTLFWLAIFLPGDEWAEAARTADVADATLVTTEEVLSEFLTAVSAHRDRSRRLACRMVREILNDPERRPETQYSLVDCISMNVMRQQQIQEILTHDRHFSQEGFVRLLGRQD